MLSRARETQQIRRLPKLSTEAVDKLVTICPHREARARHEKDFITLPKI